jgi:C-terminal processing protease CtpA/Prc
MTPVLADDAIIPKRYWTIMSNEGGTPQERLVANEALLDHAVGTINTMYYDNSGGFDFSPRDLYDSWRRLRNSSRDGKSSRDASVPHILLSTREGAVEGLKWLVSTLNDPFSKYLTREELRQELQGGNDGFLGLGAMVEAPQEAMTHSYKSATTTTTTTTAPSSSSLLLSTRNVQNLPIVTAVAPNSPAERAGVTVGDRIVAVAQDKFLGQSRAQVTRHLKTKYSAENYAGQAHVTLAKPVFYEREERGGGEVVMGYRLSKLKLATTMNEPFEPQKHGVSGDAIVQYKLLTSSDSILDSSSLNVGYIRLTRFSRASTIRFFHAIDTLEAAGAQSYIIDLRNNYGGVIQEAMLTASALLRDPHSVLCYTMNSRGGFTPHDVEEYVVDTRYPGYLLSSEPRTVSLNQVRRENPEMFDGISVPPSSFASLSEQSAKRGIHRPGASPVLTTTTAAKQWHVGSWLFPAAHAMSVNDYHLRMQKKLVLLINEGTASSAEVFASALHDNGRTVALVGSKTYGKGLIQHTFPMPDGGGLRLTVAEYLTPSLHHVTKVGSARYDQVTGDWIGGGIQPDLYCESRRGIPSDVGADFCVGAALDALEEADVQEAYNLALTGEQGPLKRTGGTLDGSGPRRPIYASIAKVSSILGVSTSFLYREFLTNAYTVFSHCIGRMISDERAHSTG